MAFRLTMPSFVYVTLKPVVWHLFS